MERRFRRCCRRRSVPGSSKILNDPGTERLLLQRRKCRSIAQIVLDRFSQNRDRPSQGCKVKCHKMFVCGGTFSRINFIVSIPLIMSCVLVILVILLFRLLFINTNPDSFNMLAQFGIVDQFVCYNIKFINKRQFI